MALIPRKRVSKEVQVTHARGLDRKEHGTLCTATRRDGEPCTNYAIKGATVCRKHGGGAPQVRRAAQVRNIMAADLLMAELLKIALDTKQTTRDRLVAIRDGLDRAGLAATQNVEITGEVSMIDKLAQDVLIVDDMDSYPDSEPIDWYANDRNIVDAEIVPDEPATLRPARREPPKQGTPTAPPLSHGETYSERSERLNRESRARESGLAPRDTGGARSSTARMGRGTR
jgi:hypothetical protein